MTSILARFFSYLDLLSNRSLGEKLNPFARLGALAIANIVVACASGVLLLPFYRVSVEGAYQSVADLVISHPRSLGLIHSIHHYSSMLAMVLSILHLLRVIGVRAFDSARAHSWITGWISTLVLWITGWTGVWLVWDQPAFLVAQWVAKLVDIIPIFGLHLEPALILDAAMNSKVFFVVFFMHMVIPLGLLLSLWIHVSRVNRPRFIADRVNFLALLLFLFVLSFVIPAPLDIRADPFVVAHRIVPDWLYVGPFLAMALVPVTWVWVIGPVVFGLIISIPFFLRKRKQPASFVTDSNCTGCANCFTDCPYMAIEMMPRTDGRPYASVAFVDPSKCVGCGICNGSCDTFGNNLPWLTNRMVMEAIDKMAAAKASPTLTFLCREVASEAMARSASSNASLISVPCAGHVSPHLVKRALDKGFQKVLIASCLPGSCCYREGDQWIRERLAEKREPVGRLSADQTQRVHTVGYPKGNLSDFHADLKTLSLTATPLVKEKEGLMRRVMIGGLIAIFFGVLVVLSDRVTFLSGDSSRAILTVTYRHAPSVPMKCRKVSEEEKAKMLPHMRRDEICERARPYSDFLIKVDDRVVADKVVKPMGLSGDGFIVGTENVRLDAGQINLLIRLHDQGLTPEQEYRFEQTVELKAGQRYIVEFQTGQGFKWHALDHP